MTLDSSPFDATTFDGDGTKLTDDLIFIAMSSSEDERRQHLGELHRTYAPDAVEQKGHYVIWLLETQAKIKDTPIITRLTAAQRDMLRIDPKWVADTLVLAEQLKAGAMHLRRLLNISEE